MRGYLSVQPSPIAGRGVFACKTFLSGDLVEICPLLLLERCAWGISATLDDYVIGLTCPRYPIALPLGYGALYNHSDAPNATWSINEAEGTMDVRAVMLIQSGEEICISYGKSYFPDRGIEPLSIGSQAAGRHEANRR